MTETPRLKKLEETKPAKKQLLKPSEILLAACSPKVTKNARLLRYYLRFLALSGAKEQEALKTAKLDVDLAMRKLAVGAGGDTKNGSSG